MIIWTSSLAQSVQPSIEAYGQLPAISGMAISPDGQHLAYISRQEDTDGLLVYHLERKEVIFAISVDELKTNEVSWASNKHVILRAFENQKIFGYRGKVRYSAAFSANIETEKVTQLLNGTRGLFAGQEGLGRIVGKHSGENKVFIPAHMRAPGRRTTYSLLEVNLDTGKGYTHSLGHEDGVDWFVDTDGTILAHETYNNISNQYILRTKRSGRWETILDRRAELPPAGPIGITQDRSGLVVLNRNQEGFHELHKLGFDGEYSDTIMAKPNTEIEYVLTDTNRVVFGVAYGGLEPEYSFFDPEITRAVNDLQDRVENASVRLVSWSDDFSRLVFQIEGTGYAGDYFLLDRATSSLLPIASSRPQIPREAIGEVLTIEYPAEDGLTIPGVMTIPNGSDMKNLPAIIMPHGGPEAHDQVGFDWMAQYFSSRGYLVFQPNFRGSDGFGRAFKEAGYGGWGGVMQQDITDGVEALKRGGMIDPDRVCIVGWSYGGYAALAGGAFTPDLYKCVAAIAPIADLPKLLYDERLEHGKKHWVMAYWERAIENGDATRESLREKSPISFAEDFTAPVLLIHGRDDLIVRINQSQRMKRALERANKEVELIQMRGEDHDLSTPGARLEALRALDTFIETHIGQQSDSRE